MQRRLMLHESEDAMNKLPYFAIDYYDRQVIQSIIDKYLQYHTEAIENAYADIDSMLKTGKPAW